MPPFAYTAWKTPDHRSSHRRQVESHEGFKIYYLPIDDDRAVIFTVHIHVSRARRFTARHHTVIFTVLRGRGSEDEEVEMELSFKSDFGPALAQTHKGTRIPMNSAQEKIMDELGSKSRRASREFNIINIDEEFPDSLDRSFRLKGDLSRGPSGILGGLYEVWMTTFPSCTGPHSKRYGMFKFDVRDPSSAARFPENTTDKNIQWMNGRSLRRVIMIDHRDITVSLSLCFKAARTIVRRKKGVFYTDPYFGRAFYRPGKNRVRQYINRRFSDLTFPRGFIRANDPWSGVYKYNGGPGLQHIEKAISRTVN